MSRSSAAVRIQTRTSRTHTERRIRVTLGELIAAAYEAAGPDADATDVRRILEALESGDGLRPRFEIA